MSSNNKAEIIARLGRLGIAHEDACALRRISMTLHRWHELECGDSNDYASWTIARGKKNKDGTFTHDDDGAPYIERHVHRESRVRYESIPDREKGAKLRLASIMKRYAPLTAFIQTDPRGAALYILRPGDVPAGEDPSAYYSRGIAVYK